MKASLLLLLTLLAGSAETKAPAPNATNAPAASANAAPDLATLKEIAPGVLEYHGVRLDKQHHRITFPAKVNQRQGAIEYLLVQEKGKVHESVISTKIMPHDIHLALLLIGLKETANPKDALPPSAIDSSYLHAAPKLQGTPVTLSVAWKENGQPKQAAAEDWVLNLETNQPMTRGVWTYNGSTVSDGVFMADEEFSIAALVTDPTALVNNPRKGYDNDQIWQPLEKAIPPLDTPVDVTITLAP